MKPKLRNALSTLCLDYVKANDPASFKIMRNLVEENYKTGRPQYSSGFLYTKYRSILRQQETTEVL